MGTNATPGSVRGRLACFRGYRRDAGKAQLEYAFAPLSFAIPARGITELDSACPVCGKPLRVAVKSRFEAAFKWWWAAAGLVVALPVFACFLYMAGSDTSGDRFGRNVLWFMGGGGTVSAVCFLPYCLYRARRPQFVDHALLLAGAGEVVGHVGGGQPVPMHEHILHN